MKKLNSWLNNHPSIKRALEGFIKLAVLVIIFAIIAFLLDGAGGVLNIL